MIRACALLATFNEADIILEAVQKLIAGGLDVFVLDNGSTDGTREILAPWVGRGIIDIRTQVFYEDGREIYNWSAILQTKEALSRELGYDWYLHVDADEIRYSPWPHLSLLEGIDKVDFSGFNLINFKLFNFRLTQDLAASGDFERDMPLYSAGESFNQHQIKAWKAHAAADLCSYGGHVIQRPDARLYPVRFIHKHYPVRSLSHGRRKILNERKARFSQAERQRGWHVQYDHLQEVGESDVFWAPERLKTFDLAAERLDLLSQGTDLVIDSMRMSAGEDVDALIQRNLQKKYEALGYPAAHVKNLMDLGQRLKLLAAKGTLPPIQVQRWEADLFREFLGIYAAKSYMAGDVLVYARLLEIKFEIQ